MMISISQVIFVVFLLFAVSRVYLQLKSGRLKPKNFLFWLTVFLGAVIGIVFPALTVDLARFLGINRGTDLIVYASIILLFYLIFRISIYLEEINEKISKLIREIGLKNVKE